MLGLVVRVLFCGSGWRTFVDILARAMPPGTEVDLWDVKDPLERVVPGYHVLLPSNGPITAEVIAAAGDLRLIQQPAAGTDNIDLAAARARGVPVCNAPGASGESVAEMALFLMLALLRRLPESRRAFADRLIGQPIGRQLRGRHLGIVGVGLIGSALARLAEGVGMIVTAVGSRRSDDEWEKLLREADVVSLHCPLTAATRGLMDGRAFSLMKPGALLINCARGPVIDRAALERALDGGRLGGAGLDVFWDEPWDPAEPLYARPNVVVMPHVGSSTEEAMFRIAAIVAANMDRISRGAPLLHRVA
jgi:phosphoglycerate dehydrogenase-like enzyme